jgi:chitinase
MKLLLGVGAYGRGFRLKDPSDTGFYAPATAGIEQGPYTRQAGFWGYNEFCEKMQGEQSQWTFVRVSLSVFRFVFVDNI